MNELKGSIILSLLVALQNIRNLRVKGDPRSDFCRDIIKKIDEKDGKRGFK
jgi:hypothetical protein